MRFLSIAIFGALVLTAPILANAQSEAESNSIGNGTAAAGLARFPAPPAEPIQVDKSINGLVPVPSPPVRSYYSGGYAGGVTPSWNRDEYAIGVVGRPVHSSELYYGGLPEYHDPTGIPWSSDGAQAMDSDVIGHKWSRRSCRNRIPSLLNFRLFSHNYDGRLIHTTYSPLNFSRDPRRYRR